MGDEIALEDSSFPERLLPEAAPAETSSGECFRFRRDPPRSPDPGLEGGLTRESTSTAGILSGGLPPKH